MIPKKDVEGIDIDDSTENINKKLININHTRMPIYSNSVNNLKGFLNKKHLSSILKNNKTIEVSKLLDYVTEPALYLKIHLC